MDRVTFVFGLALVLSGVTACGNSSGHMCSRDLDCAKGQRCADGVCTTPLEQEAGVTQDLFRAEARLDGKIAPPDRTAPDGVFTCQPNHDDKLDRSEMPIRVGAKISYSAGSGLKINLQGTEVQGRTQWDLLANATDEHPYIAELEAVASWAAPDFPAATYMSLLDAGYKTYGVFKATPSALQLIGVVSKTPPPDETKLSYGKPVDTLRFPVVVTDNFETGAIVTGPMNFFPYYASIYETYNVTVLASGSLKLPELTLDAWLVKVVVKQNPTVNPFLITTRVSFLFVAECYGIVAQIFTDEDPSSLTSVPAKERRRISKQP